MVRWSTKLSQMFHTCYYSVCINHKQVPLNKVYRQVSFYTISFCAISLLHDLKIYTTFRIYILIAIWHGQNAMFFGLTRFGIAIPGRTCLVLEASRQWHRCHVCGLLRWWYNHVSDVLPPLTPLAFVTKWVRNVNLHHLVHFMWKIG